MRPQIVSILTPLLFLASSISMLAQSASAGTSPPPPMQGPVQAPLDVDIFILIIAGVLLGGYYTLVKKLIRKNTLR